MAESISALSKEFLMAGEAPPAEIPEEYTPQAPPPQPGDYIFRIPTNLGDVWEAKKTTVDGREVQYVQVLFRGEDALVIVAGKEKVGEAFEWRVSNLGRNRARRGDPPQYVSDGVYLLRAMGLGVPKTNGDFINLMKAAQGKTFKAGLEYRGFCNDSKVAWGENPETGERGPLVGEDGVTELMGCGAKVYQSSWKKDPTTGLYELYIPCPGTRTLSDGTTVSCGAQLRANTDLRNFRSAGPAAA